MHTLSALNVYMKLLTQVYNFKKCSLYFMHNALFSFARCARGNTPKKNKQSLFTNEQKWLIYSFGTHVQ